MTNGASLQNITRYDACQRGDSIPVADLDGHGEREGRDGVEARVDMGLKRLLDPLRRDHLTLGRDAVNRGRTGEKLLHTCQTTVPCYGSRGLAGQCVFVPVAAVCLGNLHELSHETAHVALLDTRFNTGRSQNDWGDLLEVNVRLGRRRCAFLKLVAFSQQVVICRA